MAGAWLEMTLLLEDYQTRKRTGQAKTGAINRLPRKVCRSFSEPQELFCYLQKSGQTAVVGLLHFGREKTGGQFFVPAVIRQAFTADAFAAARFVGAVAVLQVLLFIGTF
jgi:hypothetical protein